MKNITNGKFIIGLLVYAVIVAVTLGFSLGGRYHGGATETGVDATSSPSITSQEGYSADGVTAASPQPGSSPGADSVTAATPNGGSGSYTGPSQAPDVNTGASPAPNTPSPTPVTPPDTVTGPTPTPAPGTTPSPTPEGKDDEDEEEETLNLFLLIAPIGLLGMTFFGFSVCNRRRCKEY